MAHKMLTSAYFFFFFSFTYYFMGKADSRCAKMSR